MRIGPCLFRTAGPCIRCNAIRTNWNEKVRVAEEEPNRTLKKFRQVDGLGILFGMYYQQEILTESQYTEVCSQKLGYKSYKESIEKNQVSTRQSDGEVYMTIK